ncbi:MAG: HD-GYP domain-containing protein, partial [Huintestinicola sp.]
HIKAGTLSEKERSVMQSHVVYTDKILKHMHFGRDFQNVREMAANHHELLNSKGYPNGIGGEKLDVMTRILTIMDIYDSLIADDRPYKKAKPVKVAFNILDEEAEFGKIDKELLEIAKEIWLDDNQKQEESHK